MKKQSFVHLSDEHMIRRLTKSEWYFEKHNAAYDAEDELMIMQLIGYPADWYPSL